MGPLIGGGIATVLTLLVLSRAIADNIAYRLAQHALVGLALGYAASALVRATIVPPVRALIAGTATIEQLVVLLISVVLLALFLTRFGRQRLSHLANYPLALLFGVGAALALLGAVRGTLAPQIVDTMRLPGLTSPDITAQIGTALVAALTLTTLLSFMYATRPGGPKGLGRMGRATGRGLILATFGVFLAAAVTTYIAALAGQLNAIIQWINLLLESA